LKSIYFTDADTGFATGMYIDTSNFTGAGIILKTIDAGQTWHNINDPGGVVMSSINFVDSQIGYATGFDGATLKTTNAGGAFSGILPIAEKENKMNIYPNPASVIVTLNIDNINNADLTLNIYNVIGTLVKTEILKQKNSQINIGDLSNGVYMISIKSKDLNENQKLIIQR
ncbi:MAG: T9SS type A sorting domain-containing protein, partial [Bacteroidetes bacterium]|nr:T9SS type A sorting domain-containing protein [Bacteroidota bacterium]